MRTVPPTTPAPRAEGEAAARAAFPDAVILRPSIVFGPEDQFFNRFAAMTRLTPVLPMVGAETRFQPVYAADVAQAILKAAEAGAAVAGKTYELGGPRIYSFKELMRLMLSVVQRRRGLLPLPFWLAKLQGAAFDLIPYVTLGLLSNSVLTRDQVLLLQKDNIVDPAKDGLAALGVKPTSAEAVLPSYLYRFRPYGQYERPKIEEEA